MKKREKSVEIGMKSRKFAGWSPMERGAHGRRSLVELNRFINLLHSLQNTSRAPSVQHLASWANSYSYSLTIAFTYKNKPKKKKRQENLRKSFPTLLTRDFNENPSRTNTSSGFAVKFLHFNCLTHQIFIFTILNFVCLLFLIHQPK